MDNQSQNKSPLQNLSENTDLALAPDSRVTSTSSEAVLPPNPLNQSSQTPNQETLTQETDKVSFEPPQSWGAPTSQPAFDLNMSPKEDLSTKQELPSQTENKTSFLKVFLISLSLILLGILLGILAAKFFQPTSVSQTTPEENMIISPTTTSTPEIETAPLMIPSPTATPEALLSLKWKNHTTEIYKLYYPQTWSLKFITNGLTISKGKTTISILAKTENEESCDKNSFYKINKGPFVWDIQESTPSSKYHVCEVVDSEVVQTTYIGDISLKGTNIDQNTLDEFKYILEKVELKFPK